MAGFYLSAGEMTPHRTAKGGQFIAKVMLAVVVAEPLYEDYKNKLFAGNIDVLHLVLVSSGAVAPRLNLQRQW